MIDFVEMLGFRFMQRAFLAGICVAVVAPLVGTFLVHREMALVGETLAHTAFAGVAIGLFVGSVFAVPVSPELAALVVAVLAALVIEWIADRTDAYGDVSMAIVLTGGFALGSVLISLEGGISVGIRQYLFGSLATVTEENVRHLVVLTLLVVGTVAVTYKQLTYATFDETAARVGGIDVTLYNRVLVVLTAGVVVAAMQIMGIILVAAMLVVPVAAASQVARSFRQSLVLSVVAAEIAVVVGVTVSYGYGTAAGGTIVLAAIAVYVAAVLAGECGSRVAGER
ncbi:metal ABC transporter permease [Halostella sp. PRR32]|uniref:metal ABC transporter permease n=1 Tax=Halostella sp. PRR32 TaxID=3098147 RepID=UPI002B1D14DB|nr:metal ABC transporter permease [Halostella sp. PRR32]